MSFYLTEVPADGQAYGRVIPPRPDWLALAEPEEILDPDLEIVDSHHHLWDRPAFRYLLHEFLEDLGSGHRIVATVFADAGVMYRATGPEILRPVGETEFVAGVAAMSESGDYGPVRVCEGIVGRADIAAGDVVEEALDRHIAAGGSRFRGIRQSGAWDADARVLAPTSSSPGLYTTPGFLRGARKLADRELVFDAWVFHPQLPDVVSLADAVPELAIVVDHSGGPIGYGPYADRWDDMVATWKRSLAALAQRPNVVLKLGGLTARLGAFDYLQLPTPLTSEKLAELWAPFLETGIELFGADRCMFESNFPVDKIGVPYASLWNAFKRVAAGASESEKQSLFNGTARRVYRLT